MVQIMLGAFFSPRLMRLFPRVLVQVPTPERACFSSSGVIQRYAGLGVPVSHVGRHSKIEVSW